MVDLKLVVTDGDPEPLPGLAPPPSGGRPESIVEKGVRRTLATLDVGEADAARVAMAVELAAIITEKRAGKRVSTIDRDFRELRELLAELTPPAAPISGQLAEAMAKWDLVVNGQHATPTA